MVLSLLGVGEVLSGSSGIGPGPGLEEGPHVPETLDHSSQPVSRRYLRVSLGPRGRLTVKGGD